MLYDMQKCIRYTFESCHNHAVTTFSLVTVYFLLHNYHFLITLQRKLDKQSNNSNSLVTRPFYGHL